MEVKSFLVGLVPFAAMVVAEVVDVGLTTLSKAAMSKGMSHFVFVVYSNALASLILLPFSFFINRKKRPTLTFSILCGVCKFQGIKFALSVCEFCRITVMQNCVFTGVNYSSPTLGSAMANLVPAFTFLLAVIFRMEKLDLRSLRSQIKVMGTLVSILGALIVTFYKGPSIGAAEPMQPQVQPQSSSLTNLLVTTNNWVIGGILFTTAGLSLSMLNKAFI
ncbi:hypothetical protein EZV62_022498 [Acer yangbiense]|uniref:WAT1-related protein n=1 Tax=Acer yangbiense TaxID=1000413 RepID=A0A5C7H9A2_9ROSI|nr:hypothetical protein EZV62_022498 [Acer yangbiense]